MKKLAPTLAKVSVLVGVLGVLGWGQHLRHT